MDNYRQLSLFPFMEEDSGKSDDRAPTSVTWNLWHGCTRASSGCAHCYMFRRDMEHGKDPTKVHKTASFNLPVRRYRAGEYKGFYKIPSGSTVFTCFTSDFFHEAADEWRSDAWAMMKERSDCSFYMITKRPQRIKQSLPSDWGDGYDNVHIAVTCENQYWTDKRLPLYLQLPIRHKSIMHEPMLEQIDISAHHLLDMINDVLDMNHIASGNMVLKAEPFAPADMLNLVNVLAQTYCSEKGVEYLHEVVGDLDDLCVGDSLRLRQVLLRILENAAKFTPEGGLVRFVTEQLPREGERCVLRFTISDNGVGIDEAFIPRMFDYFSQEDATATNRYGGSGLGLAITKKLVDMMDGEIAVESQKGVGSTFTVTVRLGAVEGTAEQTAEQTERASLAGRHILIVEDVDMNADLLADLLELEEITSERAENGRVAVDRFAQTPEGYFDAILMDLRMPVMDGLEAARTIRALPRPDASRVPIIALTANAFEEDVRQSMEAGMNAHLPKPVDTDLLYDTLRELVA